MQSLQSMQSIQNMPNQTKPTKPNLPTKPTKPNIPNQTYQTKHTKPNIPNQTHQTKPIKSNIPNQAKLTKLNKPTWICSYLFSGFLTVGFAMWVVIVFWERGCMIFQIGDLVNAVNAGVCIAFGNVFLSFFKYIFTGLGRAAFFSCWMAHPSLQMTFQIK